MSIIEWINRKNIIRYDRLLSLYPLFFFIGARIRFFNGYKFIQIKIPLRWYNKNNNGVMFGGAMCLVSDPFPALIFERIIPGTTAWTRGHSIDYLLPAKSKVIAEIEITDSDVNDLEQQLLKNGIAEKKFEYFFCDTKGRKVAKIINTAYLKKKRPK